MKGISCKKVLHLKQSPNPNCWSRTIKRQKRMVLFPPGWFFSHQAGDHSNKLTAMFSKLGYLGIKRILDDNKVSYSRFTIVQALDLKE
eukprot:8077004-Ditylum_brightwellii.AAC.1